MHWPEEATTRMGVMFLQVCMHISCVVGVWEMKELDSLTNQHVGCKYSTVYWFSLNRQTSGTPKMKSCYCDTVGLVERQKARIIPPLTVHSKYFDKNSSAVLTALSMPQFVWFYDCVFLIYLFGKQYVSVWDILRLMERKLAGLLRWVWFIPPERKSLRSWKSVTCVFTDV